MKTSFFNSVLVAMFSFSAFVGFGVAAAADKDVKKGADATKPQSPPTVVYLDKSLEWDIATGEDGHRSRLVREFFRQAFLIAARDELQLTTRDAWLGDAMPGEGDDPPFDLKSQPVPGTPLQVLRGYLPNAKDVKRYELKLRGDLPYLVTEAEKLSRTKFVESLRAAGYSGKANVWKADAPLPDRIESLLVEMNFISQFQAVRELHEAIHSGGESPALLGGLVRGYANLGLLTEYLWHPEHKVFKARALLYAQRMVVRGEHSRPNRDGIGRMRGRWSACTRRPWRTSMRRRRKRRRPPRRATVARRLGRRCCGRIAITTSTGSPPGRRRRRRPSWPDCWPIARPNLPTTRR